MTAMISLSNVESQVWKSENKTKYNLCEVCFKPFNLSNIEMHLEAGCGVEIQNRYSMPTAEPVKAGKTARQGSKKFKAPKKKMDSERTTGKKNKKKSAQKH